MLPPQSPANTLQRSTTPKPGGNAAVSKGTPKAEKEVSSCGWHGTLADDQAATPKSVHPSPLNTVISMPELLSAQASAQPTPQSAPQTLPPSQDHTPAQPNTQPGTAQASPEDNRPAEAKPNVEQVDVGQSSNGVVQAASAPVNPTTSNPSQAGPGSGGPASVPSLSSSNTALSFAGTDLLTDGGNLNFDPALLNFDTSDFDASGLPDFGDGGFGMSSMSSFGGGGVGGDDFGADGDFDFDAYLADMGHVNNEGEDGDGAGMMS
jgi:hypothetical protein